MTLPTRLLRLPPEGLHRHHNPNTSRRLPDRLHSLPQHDSAGLDPGDLRPQQPGEFPLTGAHTTVPAPVPRQQQLQSDAADGLLTAATRRTSPAPQSEPRARRFPTDCTTCHSTTTLTGPRRLQPQRRTGVPADRRAHDRAPAPRATRTTTTISRCRIHLLRCHQKDFTGDQRIRCTSGFPTDCTTCHSRPRWTPATFNHNSTSVPADRRAHHRACAQCHTNNNYITASCHLIATAATRRTSPAPTIRCTCRRLPDRLHDLPHTTTWTGLGDFNHNNHAFPLTGAHTTVACASATSTTTTLTLPTTATAATRRTSPAPPIRITLHAGFPTDCTVCHSTTPLHWTRRPSTTRLGIPAGGRAHDAGLCVQCHTNNNYTTVPNTTCIGCHQTDFNGTNNPATRRPASRPTALPATTRHRALDARRPSTTRCTANLRR